MASRNVAATVNGTREYLTEASTFKTTSLSGATGYTTERGSNFNQTQLNEAHDHAGWTLAPVVVYLIVLAIIGILGNSVTCYIFKTKMKRTAANTFILWLAVLDLVTCLFGILFDIFDIVFEYVYHLPALCKIVRFIIFATVLASWITLVAIAVDRYYKLCKPFKKPPTERCSYFIVGSTLAAIIFSSPNLYFYGTSRGVLGCSCTVDRDLLNSIYLKLHVAAYGLIVVVATLSLLIMYVRIGFQARIRSRTSLELRARPRSVAVKSRDSIYRPKYTSIRATVVCVAITIAFVVSLFPTLILRVILVNKSDNGTKLPTSALVVVNLVLRSYFISNAINPVIYGLLNPIFRRKCILMLRRLCPCVGSNFRADSSTSTEQSD